MVFYAHDDATHGMAVVVFQGGRLERHGCCFPIRSRAHQVSVEIHAASVSTKHPSLVGLSGCPRTKPKNPNYTTQPFDTIGAIAFRVESRVLLDPHFGNRRTHRTGTSHRNHVPYGPHNRYWTLVFATG